jgi:hypothetical protein
MYISLRFCYILKVYCFNLATNIIKTINTLKILIFTPQNLFVIPLTLQLTKYQDFTDMFFAVVKEVIRIMAIFFVKKPIQSKNLSC